MCKPYSSLAVEIHMRPDRRHPSGFIDSRPTAVQLNGSEVQVPACKIHICHKSENERGQLFVQRSHRGQHESIMRV